MRIPRIPTSFNNDQQVYLRDLSLAIERELNGKVGRATPTDQVLLASPSKKIYAVTVDDAGDLQLVLVQE